MAAVCYIIGKSNVAYTVEMCQSRRTVDGFLLMEIWKIVAFL